jgi:hypothetical protein
MHDPDSPVKPAAPPEKSPHWWAILYHSPHTETWYEEPDCECFTSLDRARRKLAEVRTGADPGYVFRLVERYTVTTPLEG